MISLESVQARAGGGWRTPSVVLTNVTFTWDTGVLAILGGPLDGTSVLLDVLAGDVRVRAGRASIGGRPAGSRLQVAYVPLAPSLPDALTVAEVCALAGQLRAEPSKTAAARLAVLGLERLAGRRVSTLAPGETRAVALSIALTSEAPVLLVDEPLVGLEPSTPARVVAAIRARAAAGAAVIVTTASVREGTRLADQLGVLTRGVFTHLPPSLAHVGRAGARLRVVVATSALAEASSFIAALARDPAITSIETSAFAPALGVTTDRAVAVVVSGADLLALARAVGAAAAHTRTDVEAIESAVLPLDVVRSMVGLPGGALLPSRPPPATPPPPAPPPPPAAPAAPAGPSGGA